MTKKRQDSLSITNIDAKKVRRRSYRSVISIVEAFETRLLASDGEGLQPTRFLMEAQCKGIDQKTLLEILEVSYRLVREGIQYRQQILQKIGVEKFENHKTRLLEKLTHTSG